MKIHSIKLRNVRHLKELNLDLPGPLTVIGGPNGAGKSTLQQSILAAMFFSEKQIRESFVSQFDPHSAPTVALGLSHGNDEPTIFLTRNLLDDKGEWQEGGTVLKKKRQALDKIQEVLPISADAAARLLWGRQDDMPAIVESFPSDGHTLLTRATIQGSGPDPKEIIKQLEKDSDHARKGERGGQVVGPLIQAKNTFAALVVEMDLAVRADQELCDRLQQLQNAKTRRDQVTEQFAAVQARIEKLVELESLIGPALDHISTRDQMAKTQLEWEGLEEEIDKARKDLTSLQNELGPLLCQHRVARDEELARQIDGLEARIELAEAMDAAAADLAKQLKARNRPDPADVTGLDTLQSQVREDQTKMEATGVRYELAAERGPRTLRLSEEGQPPKEIALAAGQVHRGIVGRLTIEADGLRFSAAGKEDLSALKDTIRRALEEIQTLFKKFELEDETAFRKSAEEKDQLKQALKTKKQELQTHLGAETIRSLKNDFKRLQDARLENNMTLQDREACAGKILSSAAEISNWCSDKRGEIRQAKDGIAAFEEKRPNDAQKNLHQKNLEAIRRKAREAAAAFADVDELHREPSRDLQTELGRRLENERRTQQELVKSLLEAREDVAGLGGQLKQAQPHRAPVAIQADLEEAKEVCNREETLQEARALLSQRIAEKMDALAAHVPVELGKRVTQHLERLTGGAAGQVVLSQQLAVAHVGGNGVGSNGAVMTPWHPRQLSYGESHQAALAVKIAVACALAETSGPVFIILDDSLVTFDPRRRAATEDFLLDLVDDHKLQVILLTCHTDWAADWQRRRPGHVNYLDFEQCVRYYRESATVVSG